MRKKNTKNAYFQGADQESVDGKITSNNPEKLGYPGNIGYSREPMAVPVGGDSRDWETKWYSGAAAKTKQVMGPKGSEFALKQEWQRIPSDEKIANASLSAGFTRTAKPAASFWTVYATDKKTGKKTAVLKANLGEIWGDELSEKTANKSASPDYGKAVIEKIRNKGIAQVAYLLTGNKSYLKKAQLEQLEVEDSAPMGDMSEFEGGDDLELAINDEADQTAAEADVTGDVIGDKKVEIENVQTQLVEQTSPESTADVFVKLQDAEKMLEEAQKEMEQVASKLRDRTLTAANKIKLIKLAAEAQEDAIATLTETDDILEQAVEAANEAIAEAKDLMEGGDVVVDEDDMDATEFEDDMGDDVDDVEVDVDIDGLDAVGNAKNYLAKRATMRKRAMEEEVKYQVTPDGAPKDGDDEINRAHPNGGAAVSDIPVGGPVADDGEIFETVIEQQDKDLSVANKMPTGQLSSKAAARLKVKTAAAVDQATKDFWEKELYGKGDAASKQFGKDMTKNYADGATSTVEAAVSEAEAKIVRAYELAEVASDKGFCDRTAAAKTTLAKQIRDFDDKAFVSFKKMIDEAPVRTASVGGLSVRTAAVLPKVGQVDGAETAKADDFEARLGGLGWK